MFVRRRHPLGPNCTAANSSPLVFRRYLPVARRKAWNPSARGIRLIPHLSRSVVYPRDDRSPSGSDLEEIEANAFAAALDACCVGARRNRRTRGSTTKTPRRTWQIDSMWCHGDVLQAPEARFSCLGKYG